MTLKNARANSTYLITEVAGTDLITRRLLSMGFTPNTQIYIVAIAPFKGTILAKIRNRMIALRTNAAMRIKIKQAYEAK